MRRENVLRIISAVIALLFFYTAISKLIELTQSKSEMINQVFPVAIALVLVWAVPLTELFVVGLLLYQPLRLKGFYASLILLSAFTIYIAITMTGTFGRIPCSCGGILKHMSYQTHLIFNLFFLIVTGAGIFIERYCPDQLLFKRNKERGPIKN
ncbi:MauE/DoxX family redox-associated membrane protein [Pedobacter lusitanus]|uniref:MauE/DoxX family redox-associated membrane protein n=1 Tax=Pedobacter lusitanus TaxID=1503925 RepID=UPI000698528E|nr:MauE/DoxX family redox-associated membrane protein [Pedobacter lusitanus]